MTSRGHVGLSHGRESGFPPGEGGGRGRREECRIRSAAGLRGMANDGFVKKSRLRNFVDHIYNVNLLIIVFLRISKY